MKSPRFTREQLLKTACAPLNPHLKEQPKAKKRSKYGNNRLEWNGEKFDSEKELNRYKELLLLLKVGEIGLLRRQVRYQLNDSGESIVYVADFVYLVAATGQEIVEDVKSEFTRKLPVYRIKKKLMKSILNIEIKET